jgi:hypothetical protein
LRNNKLTGTLPTQLGRMTGLRQVILQDNDLTGPIPTELGQLTQMSKLLMHLNGFSGTIPTQFGQFTACDRYDERPRGIDWMYALPPPSPNLNPTPPARGATKVALHQLSVQLKALFFLCSML